jgi:DNA uptake protein ComE-like DNA-binding protein
MVFAKSAYDVAPASTAAGLLLDLREPNYVNLFKYLTVMDPAAQNVSGMSTSETRIKGRINVNTAPAFVLAQLPWMQSGDGSLFEKARAVVDHRDSYGAYETIAALMQVTALHGLALDSLDNQHDDTPRGPDLTPDTALDDFEERDLIFTRISDLTTVRSDVFTAYIVVRIGTDGPQKRMMVIFDRSGVLSASDPVEIVAVHQVPDPR